jgi:glycosyltransferase involved in cell wall biosynthesis
MRKLLYVCEADSGGIMEYAIRQSAAIAQEGVEVHFLCKPSFPVERLAEGIKVWEFDKSRGPSEQRRGLAGKIFRVWRMISDLRSEARQVDQLAEKLLKDSSTRNSLPVTSHDLGEAEIAVLFACYKEYFAPFWVWPLRRLAKKGIVIGTIAHDPVRDFVVGLVWWHRWSVRLGYSFVRDVFVHDDTVVDFGGRKPSEIRIHQIPHGPYEVAAPKIGREAMRRKLGFDSVPSSLDSGRSTLDSSAPADVVFLAFGQIRDGKNLDLFLLAMTHLPKHVKLLVAGKGDSGSSRPPEYYQKLAEELGVGDRCRWDIRRIPEDEVGDIFAACDVVLVTYSAKFRSASGVLNAAVSARKQMLASSGAGPLKTVVEKYHLGVFVEPDDLEEIVRGASKFVPNSATEQPATRYQLPATSAWERYECENSWEENARRVFQAFES